VPVGQHVEAAGQQMETSGGGRSQAAPSGGWRRGPGDEQAGAVNTRVLAAAAVQK
jgi:hypothetical protein